MAWPSPPLQWLDVEEIAEELAASHPGMNPAGVSFPRLRDLVEALANFRPRPGQTCNERILEAIQRNWLEIFVDEAMAAEEPDDEQDKHA